MKKLIESLSDKNITQQDIKNANRVNLLAFAWAATLLIAPISLELQYEESTSKIFIISLFIVHVFIGIKMIGAYKQFLKNSDEMQRQIQFSALATSVGAAVLSFSSYSILEVAKLVPELKPEIIILIMSFSYIGGIIRGKIKYN